MHARAQVEGHEPHPADGRLAGRRRGARRARGRAGPLDGLRWIGRARARHSRAAPCATRAVAPGGGRDLDARGLAGSARRFEADPAARRARRSLLCLDGLATVAEVFLNGELCCESDSMFAPRELDVGARLRGDNELLIRCRALAPAAGGAAPAAGPLAHAAGRRRSLRFFRTMLLGRAPGFAPGPAAVGPWRPVWLERRRRASPSTS